MVDQQEYDHLMNDYLALRERADRDAAVLASVVAILETYGDPWDYMRELYDLVGARWPDSPKG